MLFGSPLAVSRTGSSPWFGEQPSLARSLFNLGLVLRNWRARLATGELSRAPLRLLRFELGRGGAVCEWIARPPDSWDVGLRPEIGMRHASEQALRDAIAVRALVFKLIPGLDNADFRIYRESSLGLELIITGEVQRENGCHRRSISTPMRAKLMGLRFELEEGILCGSPVREPHIA